LSNAVRHNNGLSPAFLEALGDAQFQAGQPAEALQNWIKAREKGSGSSLLDQKIRDKTWYE